MHILKKATIIIGWFGLYKVAWVCAILGGGVHGYPILSALPMLMWSLAWIFFQPNRKANTIMAVVSGLCGVLWDSGLVITGVMEFPAPAQALFPSPPWMISLWISFGAITHASFYKMYGRYVWAVIIGGIGGPMAYWGGVATDALIISSSKEFFLGMIALEWAIAFPFLLWAGQRVQQKYASNAL